MGVDDPRPPAHHAGAGIRHAGADALHERRPALQGGVGIGAVPGRTTWPTARASAGRCAARSRTATTARSRSSPAARCSHRFAQNGTRRRISRTRCGARSWSSWTSSVVEMWQRGEWDDFCGMLPEYAAKGHGEGFMHDTAMLLGALGWDHYDGRPKSSRHISAVRAPGRSMPFFRYRRCRPIWPSSANRVRRRWPAAASESAAEAGILMPHLVILYIRQRRSRCRHGAVLPPRRRCDAVGA